jgi:hypothetical protein
MFMYHAAHALAVTRLRQGAPALHTVVLNQISSTSLVLRIKTSEQSFGSRQLSAAGAKCVSGLRLLSRWPQLALAERIWLSRLALRDNARLF